MTAPDKGLVNVIASYVRDHIGDTSAFRNDVISLRAMYNLQAHDGIQVDYDRFALPFLWLYYFANAAKVKIACHQLLTTELPPNPRVLDMGCGSGASVVGLIEYLLEGTSISRIGHIEINLVDQSPKQLQILEDTTGRYICNRFSDSIHLGGHCVDVREFLKTKDNLNKYTIALASNLFCEIPSAERIDLVKAVIGALSEDGVFLVVERKETNILLMIEDAANWASHEIKVSGPHELSGLEHLQSLLFDYPLKKDFGLACGIFKKSVV